MSPIDRIVPCLIADEVDFSRLEKSVSVFLESTHTETGWRIDLIFVCGETQARQSFSPVLSDSRLLPSPGTNVELLSGVDDAVAVMFLSDQRFEAVFSRHSLDGLVRFRFAEPTDLRGPAARSYNHRYSA